MDEQELTAAAEALRAGKLVGLPTETVYGLGANALDPEAVARVFEAKGRPRFDPLIVHVPDAEAARGLVLEWPETAEALAAAAWPGPLTLVLPKRPEVPDLVTAGLPSVAVRVPGHPLTLALLRKAGVPVAAPSANRFGGVSPTTAEHVRSELGERVELVLDGGPCRTGVESTVLSLLEERPRLLRPGGFPLEEIETLVGEVLPPPETAPDDPGGKASPGLLSRHYATRTPLRLAATLDEAFFLAEGRRAGLLQVTGVAPAGFAVVEELSPERDLVQAAAGLFAAMRRLDEAGLDLIVACPPAPEGLGRAIADRLRRAAAKTGGA
jgi:L-threonylcarbamoyladenylate synthase